MAGFNGFNTNALMPTPLQQSNPLEMAGQAATLKNALLGNQIQQSEYDAKMAQGNALLGATDASGRTDYGKARATMAGNPKAAYGAADAFQSQNVSRNQDILNQDAQLSLEQHQSKAAANAMGETYNAPTNTNLDGYAAFQKTLTPHASAQIDAIRDQVKSLPTVEQRQQALKSAFTAHMGQDAASRAFGAPSTMSDGQNNYGGTTDQYTGAFTPASRMQLKTSPEYNNTYADREIMTPQGLKKQSMTNAQYAAYQQQHGGFTGRVDVTGNGSSKTPDTAIPIGAEEQTKTGLAIKNELAGNVQSYRDENTNWRNITGLIHAMASDNQFRGLKLAEASNLASKLGWGGNYATLVQELDKAAGKARQSMMQGGSGPHTNAGMQEISHITPSTELTIPAALALAHEGITDTSNKIRRGMYVQKVENPMDVPRSLGEYDALYDPRFETIQRLGPQEGRAYAASHIADKAQYAASVRRMAQAQRDGKYDFGLTPAQVDRILGHANGR